MTCIAVLCSRPGTKLKCIAPAYSTGFNASLGQGNLNGIYPCRCSGVDNITGKYTYRLCDMSVLIFTKIAVVFFLAEFLYLSRQTYHDGVVFIYLIKNCLQYRVLGLGKQIIIIKIDAKLLCRKKKMIVIKIAEALRISGSRCVIPLAVYKLLGRIAIGNKEVTVFVLYYHFSNELCCRIEDRINNLLKLLLILSELVVVPEHLSCKTEISGRMIVGYLIGIYSMTENPAVTAICARGGYIVPNHSQICPFFSSLHIRLIKINICLKGFCKIGAECSPIIHLGIDIVRIVT